MQLSSDLVLSEWDMRQRGGVVRLEIWITIQWTKEFSDLIKFLLWCERSPKTIKELNLLSFAFGTKLTNTSMPIQDLMTQCKVNTVFHENIKALTFILRIERANSTVQYRIGAHMAPALKHGLKSARCSLREQSSSIPHPGRYRDQGTAVRADIGDLTGKVLDTQLSNSSLWGQALEIKASF